MNRQDVIDSLEAARLAHAHWLIFGGKLYRGTGLDTVQTPLRCTECAFGKWFYAEHDCIKHIPGFSYMEKLHEDFHLYYDELFKNAQSFHSKSKCLIRCEKRKAKKEASLKNDYLRLKEKSSLLIEQLLAVEKTINQMSDKSFIRSRKFTELA
ncbi:MAG: CZB domain-containing protein [Cocleimonas sp.]